MHADPIEGSGHLVKAMTEMDLEQMSTSSIVCGLLYAQCEVTARAARRLRLELLEHGARIDASIDEFSEDDLERLKNQVLLTDAIAEEQDEVCALLPHAVGAGFTTEGLEGPLGLMTTTASATNRLVDRLDVRAENLHRRYQDVKQELLSRRLGVLTMLSAVFLPLTLLAGIWGMNFEYMPELDDPYAYPAALGLMALVGAGGVWFFRKHGWFD